MARLRERGSLTPAVVREGRLVSLDAHEILATLMVDGAVNAGRVDAVLGQLLAWATGSGHRVRIFGEMVALLAAAGNPTATIGLEECWNALQQTYAFTLHCGYPLPQLAAESQVALFQDICAVHAHVIPAESYHGQTSEGDRQRTVAFLQQKAHRLEAEIAERRRAEEQLRQALQETEAALRLREEFLSIAAHELRNPLTALSLHAQLAQHRLAREGESEALRAGQTLAAIAGQAERLSAIVDRLLDVSCLISGQLGLRRQEVDLVTLVNNVIAQMTPASHDRQMRLTAPAALQADVDPVRVEQVLLNLLDNAIKFSPPETAIEIEVAEIGPGVAGLSIRDHGRGVPEEAREKIFERYYQVPDSGAVQGFGLGLWVSRQIVELHGGQIRAEFPAGGTNMVVSLPVVAPPS
jgi:signal transduction histidine kinase